MLKSMLKAIIRSSVLWLLLVFILEGCAVLSPELKTLKSVGDSQKEIAKYISRQEKFFLKLLAHYQRGRLRVGTAQNKILSAYGEPIAVYRWGDSLNKEYYLYRHPTDYFTSDKIYLYFDEMNKLLHWEYEPYRQ